VTLITIVSEGIKVPVPGKLLLPSKTVLDIAHKAEGTLIALANHPTQENTISIACGPTKWNLKTLNVETYGVPASLDETEVHT
jgi:hypothetical protein